MPGRKKDRRQKTAGDSEDRNHQRVHSYREEKGCGRNECHESERREQSKEREVIERPAGEGDGVKNENASRAQCLRRDDILFALQQKAAADKRNPGEKSNRNP